MREQLIGFPNYRNRKWIYKEKAGFGGQGNEWLALLQNDDTAGDGGYVGQRAHIFRDKF